MVDHLKTAIVVVLMTALIWAFAESESLRTQEIRTELSVGSGAQDRIARIEPGERAGESITLRVEGPTARLDALAQSLRGGVRLEPGMPGVPSEPGIHRIDLQAVLRTHPVFRDSGVTVLEVHPPAIEMLVDDIVERRAKVNVAVPGADVEGTPEPTPPEVVVRLPGRLAADLPPDLAVTARVDPASLVNLREGSFATLPNIRVEPPATAWGPEFVRVEPPTVEVRLALRSRSATLEIPVPVPIHIRLAPAEAREWDIAIDNEDRFLTGVSVTGPRDLIELIRTEKLKVIAWVPLTWEELERAAESGGIIEKEATFSDLPTPILKFDVERRPVRLTVSRRSSSVPESGAAQPGG